MRVRVYGMIYPFIELGLGFAYLAQWHVTAVNIVTLVVMSFGAFGVLSGIKSGKKIDCACMGSFIKVPLSRVALAENVSMALMAAWMLITS